MLVSRILCLDDTLGNGEGVSKSDGDVRTGNEQTHPFIQILFYLYSHNLQIFDDNFCTLIEVFDSILIIEESHSDYVSAILDHFVMIAEEFSPLPSPLHHCTVH